MQVEACIISVQPEDSPHFAGSCYYNLPRYHETSKQTSHTRASR